MGAWGAIADSLGVDARVVGVKETAAVMAALAEEVSRRSQSADEQHADWYLVVHDLGQFRDLRKTEDDFSFSSSKEVTPDRLFRDILREGPGVGVHVLVWSDSYNAMNRSIDRLSLREIDYRVAFQMSSADSTGLIDSPLAARLGENRALLYRDDLGTLEKFPPPQPAQRGVALLGGRTAAEASPACRGRALILRVSPYSGRAQLPDCS